MGSNPELKLRPLLSVLQLCLHAPQWPALLGSCGLFTLVPLMRGLSLSLRLHVHPSRSRWGSIGSPRVGVMYKWLRAHEGMRAHESRKVGTYGASEGVGCSPLSSWRQRCSVCNLLSRPLSPFRAEGQWGLPPQRAPRPKLWASTLPAVSVGMTYVALWPPLLRYGGINHPVSGEGGRCC